MVERALIEPQRSLERGDHPGAAGMTGEAIDVAEGKTDALQDARHGRPDLPLGKRWNGAVEHHAQALVIDIPAHDVERARPQVLARAFDAGNPGFARAHDASRVAVAEQCRGDDAALVSWSARKAVVQISSATISTRVPGRAAASRLAIARPDTPPAQPSPNTGTRPTSARKPMRLATRASTLGVAMPVDDMVTTTSMSLAPRPAASSARVAAPTNSTSAPSR